MLYYYITVLLKKQEVLRIFFNSGKKRISPPPYLWKNTAFLRHRAKKHGSSASGTAVLHVLAGLLLLRCADRTCICACAALKACICVDDVLAVALRDCADRTCVCTCTALDASITDYVCHNVTSCYIKCGGLCSESGPWLSSPIVSYFRKKSSGFQKYFLRARNLAETLPNRQNPSLPLYSLYSFQAVSSVIAARNEIRLYK